MWPGNRIRNRGHAVVNEGRKKQEHVSQFQLQSAELLFSCRKQIALSAATGLVGHHITDMDMDRHTDEWTGCEQRHVFSGEGRQTLLLSLW